MSKISPVRPSVLSVEAMASSPDYIIESAEFRQYISQKRIEAVRKRDDLITETDRLQAELQARTMRITDLDEIVARCDAALGLDIRTIGASTSAPAEGG